MEPDGSKQVNLTLIMFRSIRLTEAVKEVSEFEKYSDALKRVACLGQLS